MRPSRPPSWATAEWSTSLGCSAATPRRSARGRRNWRARTSWTPVASEKRGWTETADRRRAGPRRELSEGARRPHRRRSDAGRRQVDQSVAAPDRRADGRSGDRGEPHRGVPIAAAARLPPAQGAEEEDHGSSSRSERAVREDRPPEEEVPEGRTAGDQHRHEEEGVAREFLP